MRQLTSRVQSLAARGALSAARRLGPDTGEYRLLRDLTPIACSRVEPLTLFHTSDLEMGPHIWRRAAYDRAEMERALEILGQPQRNRTVVEVGANVGTTTIALLRSLGASRVEAFEPEPANFRLLRCNLVLNDLEDRAAIHRIAISDREGSVEMEVCDWNRGDHRVRAVDAGDERLWESTRPTLSVPARRLDDAVSVPDGDIGLFWVDTQGHEANVLAGAERLLGLGVPWVIEYWPYGLRRAAGLDRLHRLITDRFRTVIDVRQSASAGRPCEVDPADLVRMVGEAPDAYTDLALLP